MKNPANAPPLMPYLNTLLDLIPTPLLISDSPGSIALINAAARQLLDAKEGDSLASLHPPLAEAATRALDSGERIDLPIKAGDHLLAATLIPGTPQGGEPLCASILGTVPIDQRLRDFEELTRELDAIINSASDGLFVCDGDANVIRMNPASEKIHKLDARNIIGMNMRDLIDRGFIDRSAALEVTLQKKPVSLLQNKDGRKLISIGTPVFDENHALIRVVVSERDITEIDKLQRELEEQEGLKASLRNQMLEMQQKELESRRIIAKSPGMIRALQQSLKVAAADSSVLVLGESGVGKGVIADIIHQHSPRSKHPLIKLNCGAIPESLIEAELFGYEKGAFTGASTSGKPGQFELANEGTLFLDEIAELPLAAQVKLLRFLEDGCITRIGGVSSRTVNVRVLAATHRNLEEMVAAGTFRLDLYYRLNVIPIQVPALRERKDCIIPLIHHYIDHFSTTTGAKKKLSRSALETLASYSFPGNVRELMNICERLVVMTDTDIIDIADLPARVTTSVEPAELATFDWTEPLTLQQAVESIERNLLARAKERFRSQTEIAEALDVNQSTIARKLKKYGLSEK